MTSLEAIGTFFAILFGAFGFATMLYLAWIGYGSIKGRLEAVND